MSSLTYDQKSEIRMAFDEAYVPADRRRAARVKHQVNAEIIEWRRGRQGSPFSVRIEDFSPSGVGLVHDSELSLGTQYLLTVPRPNLDDLIVQLTVVRCEPQDDGLWQIGLELSSVMDRVALGQFVDALNGADACRLTSRRTRVLFLLLGLFGIGMSLVIG